MPSFPPPGTAAPRKSWGSSPAPFYQHAAPTPDGTTGAHRMPPVQQLELARGAPGPQAAAAHVPPAGCHGGSRLQGCVPGPTVPYPWMMLLTQLRLGCTPHPPPPPRPLSPGQHCTPVLGRGRKPHREMQASTSKPHREPQCPPPNHTKSCSVHLQVPYRAAASTSEPL